jgi:DNA polymerase III subunit gamma/tau
VVVWDLKYRPSKFGDVLGQPGTVQLLKARLAKGTALDINYIFSGAWGSGKTTLARILARAMLCLNVDKTDPEPCNMCENCRDILDGTPGAYVEQDAASGGTIDNIRAIVEDLPFAVFNAPKRVYVFDESHRMSRDAQDVLLKPLEEKRMCGIFCTTEPEKIRGPIRSRCEEYTIRKITREDVLVRMKKILDVEGIHHEDDGVLTVIDYSGGHVRDIVNRLEMIAQMGEVSLATVREYLHLSVVATYYEVLLSLGSPMQAVERIEQACERVSPEEVSAGLAEAAMNSFRLAHGMFTDFVYVDKGMCQKVHALYGDKVVRLADFFLQRRYTSKVALICDVLSLSEGVPAAPVVSSAPILIVTPSLIPPTIPVAHPLASSAPVPASSAPTPPSTTKVNGNGKLRSDGVGSLGSGDLAALTDLDHKVVAREKPRGRDQVNVPINFGGSVDGDELGRILTPDEWRRIFESTWPGRG